MSCGLPRAQRAMLISDVKVVPPPRLPCWKLKQGHLKEIKEQISNKKYLFHYLFTCLHNPSYIRLRDHLKFWGPLSRLSEALKWGLQAAHY
jgi:hypothetical protein